MGDLTTLIGGGSVLGLLIGAFGFFLRGAAADRKELAAERAGRDLVEKDLDAERKLRRAAEDREARLTREVARLGEKVDELTTEVTRLRDRLDGKP